MKKRNQILILIIFTTCMISSMSFNIVQQEPYNESFFNLDIISSWVRNGSITYSSNTAISNDADSGSGIFSDPYIIENRLIELNGSGTGMTFSNTNAYTTVRNCWINESGTGGTDYALGISSSNNVKIENCTLGQAGNIGIAILNASNTVIFNSTLNNNTYNVYTEMSNDTIFNETVFINGGTIELAQTFLITGGISNNYSILNCNFSSIQNITATMSLTDAKNVLIDNNIMEFGSYAIFIQDLENWTISNNNISHYSNSAYAITLGRSNGSTRLFENNLITDINDTAVRCNSNYTTIRNNIINGTNMSLYHTGNDCTIENNTFINNIGQSNVYIHHDSNNNNFTRNFLDNGGSHGLFVAGANNTVISNNTISNYNTTGIKLSSTTHVLIYNNSIFNIFGNIAMENTGIHLEWAHHATIWKNDIYNSDSGVKAYFTSYNSTNVTIKENYISNCNYSLHVQNYSIYNYTIIDNFFDKVNITHFKTMSSNAYLNNNSFYHYFDTYPFAVTISPDSLILEHAYLNDSAPRYHEDFYPRDQQIAISYFSNYDYFGFDFNIVKTYIDGIQIATSTPIINHVLFVIQIRDFANVLLFEEIYNINSSIHYNIGLNIGTVNFINNGDIKITVFIEYANVTISFELVIGQEHELRLAESDDYSYWIENENGTAKATKDFEVDQGYSSFDVGWFIIDVQEEIVPVLNLLDYLLVIGIIAIISILFAVGATRGKSRRSSRYL